MNNAAIAKQLNNRGSALCDAGETEQGLRCYKQAIKLDPKNYRALFNAGFASYDLQNLQDSIEYYAEAVAAKPGFYKALNNLGVSLIDSGRNEEAEPFLRRAIDASEGKLGEPWNNLGRSYDARRLTLAAESCYRKATELSPYDNHMHVNLGINLLRQGKLTDGWAEYAYRETNPDNFPQWDGAPLNGRKLLLQGEQGYGDMIQFIRFAMQIDGDVYLDCPRAFGNLFDQLPLKLIRNGERRPDLDVACSLLRLPMLLGTTLENIPPAPYLRADEAKKASFLARFLSVPAHMRKIGVVWQGNPRFGNRYCVSADSKRSIPLENFRTLFDQDVQMFSFQKGFGTEQLRDDDPIIRLELGDFSDTAAAMSCMDLVISADTSPCHLSGALGIPTWVPLPYEACWRWLENRSDSPYYSTTRLFRQKKPGDWGTVFKEIRGALHGH